MKREPEDIKKEIALFYRVAQTVHSLEINELLREIVQIAIEVTHGDSCLIYVLDPKKDELVLRASKASHPKLMQKIKMKLSEGITGWVAKEKQPVAISDQAHSDPRFKYFRSLPEDQFAAFLSVPILNKRGVVGVINVQHKDPHAHSETLQLKEALVLRKLIEKAKGILMQRKKISEKEAYRLMQKQSMQSRKSLKELAEAVILAEELKLGD